MKRIAAIAGILLLLSMYGATLVFALMKSPDASGWFKLSICGTIVVPVLLYGYRLAYQHLKNRRPDSKKNVLQKKEKEQK